jgi:hypothetical protein
MTIISLIETTLLETVRKAFAAGPPNGWLLGWLVDRHFSGFAQAASPVKARNVTTFDYAFCNHFEARINGLTGGRFATLTVMLSFIADVYVLHWTLYESDGRTGQVVAAAPSEEAAALQGRIKHWLAKVGFLPLPDSWHELRLDGIELELSGARNVTLGKCLFRDYDG